MQDKLGLSLIVLLLLSFMLAVSVTTQPSIAQEVTITPITDTPFLYVVAYVDYDDRLNVRSGPGVQYEVVNTLYPGRLVEITGEGQRVGDALWLPINSIPEIPDEAVIEGWVNRFYLAEQMNPAYFCDDPKAQALIEQLTIAVQTQDGDLLAELVYPERGLYTGDADIGRTLNLSIDEVRQYFTNPDPYDWGENGYTGDPVVLPIREFLLPRLEDAFTSEKSTVTCYIQQEDKLYVNFPISSMQWLYGETVSGPYFPNGDQNFYSILRPGTPGNEFDYVGWGIGIEYWDGEPYLNALITYGWIP